MSHAARSHRFDASSSVDTAPGVPWADGQITLRVRGPGPEPGRILRSSGPTFLVGRHPRADLRLAVRDAAPRHLLLILDRRGLLGVDLLSRTGTRRAGREIGASWLRVGDTLELAGHRLEILRLRGDGAVLDPVPGTEDLFASGGPDLPWVTIQPVHGPNPSPWVLDSPLAFLGRSSACALQVPGLALAPIHCAIWKEPGSVRVIQLAGRTTEVNGQPVTGSAPLADGDVLRVGLAHFAVTVDGPAPAARPALVSPSVPALIEPDRCVTDIDLATGTVSPEASDAPNLAELMTFLRQFQGDAATLIEGQFDQIHQLRAELAALRDELRGEAALAEAGPPPFDLAIPASLPVADSSTTAAWMLDRIGELEPETQSRWGALIRKWVPLWTARTPSESPAVPFADVEPPPA